MARRKNQRETGLFTWLLDSPWYVSVVFTAFLFIGLKWLIPTYLASSPRLLPVSNSISGLAPFSLFFLIPGLLSFIKTYRQSITPETVADVTGYRPSQNANHSHELSTGISPEKSEAWSIALLRQLEWKRFEMLCAEYFRVLGKRVETLDHGADGGVDARVYKDTSSELEFAIQCKAWKGQVGVKEVRELFGVMAHESAGKGIFITTSTYTSEAIKFALDHADKLFLVDGEKLLRLIKQLPDKSQSLLLKFATEGDFITPTCASCGIKLIKRQGKSGNFWGCRNYPRCRTTLKLT